MILAPPGAPSTMNGLPSRTTMVGVIEESGRLPRLDGVGFALDQPEHVRLARLGGEIVHFVVQQKAEARNRHAVAVADVQRVGDRHGVALASTTL